MRWLKTDGAGGMEPPEEAVISFSGGVADCIETEHSPFAFGDLGPLMGKAIGESALCRGEYRLGSETIRATVIGAGCHSTQLSGSTVFHRNVEFPLKNLQVAALDRQQQEQQRVQQRFQPLQLQLLL